MDHLRALADLQEQFLETTRRADPATPIPWLGRWRVEQLVVHLARIHHWAAGQARREQAASLGRGPFDLPRLYAECADELRATLAALDPAAPAWTLLDDGPPPAEPGGSPASRPGSGDPRPAGSQRPGPVGTVAFWHRRQAHETLVHLWDLRAALGEDVDAAAELWLDCLDEVVTVMHPRQLRLGRVPVPASPIAFRADESDAALTLAGSAHDADAVTVRAPAKALALLAWGRLGLDDPSLAVHGDRAVAAAVLEAGLTP